MKPLFLLLAIFFCRTTQVFAQIKDYKVVFDVTSKDTNVHKAVIRWCNEIIKTSPEAKVEVVYYGQSLEMITQGKSVTAADITRLGTGRNVSFKVCSTAMKRWGIETSQLLPGVTPVPDGIFEIFLKQREGYGYIKASL